MGRRRNQGERSVHATSNDKSYLELVGELASFMRNSPKDTEKLETHRRFMISAIQSYSIGGCARSTVERTRTYVDQRGTCVNFFSKSLASGIALCGCASTRYLYTHVFKKERGQTGRETTIKREQGERPETAWNLEAGHTDGACGIFRH